MSTMSWLHLSDWHESGGSHDRNLTCNALLKDIEQRASISGSLKDIDFILFSGDIAFSGAKAQYERAKTTLIDPIRKAFKRDIPIYFVPGNHDIERTKIARIPKKLQRHLAQLESCGDWQKLNDAMTEPATAEHLNRPLSNYFDFLATVNSNGDTSKLYCVHRIKKDEFEIGLICINTAWNSARFHLSRAPATRGAKPWQWDYGLLRITEAQLQSAISELELGGKFDLGIMMMHHPLHWIDEHERAQLEQMLFRNFHIIIHGHEHRPNVNQISSAFGDLVYIPAGATYTSRLPGDPRYTNAYNYCVLDTKAFVGTVYHRIWSDVTRTWEPDERYWLSGQSQFVLAKTKTHDPRLAHKAIVSSSKKYSPFIPKRSALLHQVTVLHKPEVVGGESFICQQVKIRIKMRKGPTEPFPWRTGVDPMIVEHPNSDVRKRAYKLIAMNPAMESVPQTKKHLHVWKSELSVEEQWLEYEYEKLDLPNNFYFAEISRFTDEVELNIKEAPGYEYAYLPIGGFPPLEPKPDDFFGVDTIKTQEMILPGQGYIFQWRPKHNAD